MSANGRVVGLVADMSPSESLSRVGLVMRKFSKSACRRSVDVTRVISGLKTPSMSRRPLCIDGLRSSAEYIDCIIWRLYRSGVLHRGKKSQ